MARTLWEVKSKRDQILESEKSLLLSKNDFNKYFLSKESETGIQMEQQNVGDCYLLAAIYALSISPYFEIMCRSSMKRNSDGSWQVKIPLLNKEGRIINITQEELLSSWNKNFLKQHPTGRMVPDLRVKLLPVKAKEGIKVLEAAFIKQKFGSVNRLSADGGSSHQAILELCGNNFYPYLVESFKYDQENKLRSSGLDFIKGKSEAYLDFFLENFNSGIYIATAATRLNKKTRSVKFLFPLHSYSISSVDIKTGMINLVNPINTSQIIRLTIKQFKENFSHLYAVIINETEVLKNINSLEK